MRIREQKSCTFPNDETYHHVSNGPIDASGSILDAFVSSAAQLPLATGFMETWLG